MNFRSQSLGVQESGSPGNSRKSATSQRPRLGMHASRIVGICLHTMALSFPCGPRACTAIHGPPAIRRQCPGKVSGVQGSRPPARLRSRLAAVAVHNVSWQGRHPSFTHVIKIVRTVSNWWWWWWSSWWRWWWVVVVVMLLAVVVVMIGLLWSWWRWWWW